MWSQRRRSEGAELEGENKRGGGVEGVEGRGVTLSQWRGWWGFLVLEFFGPQMALAYRLDTISQGLKNSPFRAQLPPTCPRNVSVHIKNITHGAI